MFHMEISPFSNTPNSTPNQKKHWPRALLLRSSPKHHLRTSGELKIPWDFGENPWENLQTWDLLRSLEFVKSPGNPLLLLNVADQHDQLINWSTANFRNIEIQPRTLPVGAVAAGSPARRRNAHAQPSASGSVIGVRQIIAIALWGSLHGLRIPLRIPLRIALTLKKTPWNNFDIFINIPWWFQSNQIGNLAYRNLLDSALSTRNVVPMKVQKQEDCQVWNIYIIEPSNFGRKTCWAQLLCWYLSFFS